MILTFLNKQLELAVKDVIMQKYFSVKKQLFFIKDIYKQYKGILYYKNFIAMSIV